jgi:hypothetical protein
VNFEVKKCQGQVPAIPTSFALLIAFTAKKVFVIRAKPVAKLKTP